MERQATSPENKKSILDFNKELQRVLGEYVDRSYPTAIAFGATQGLLSVVPLESDATRWVLLGGGVAASYAHAIASARRGDIGNQLSRMQEEFAKLLRIHYLTNAQALDGAGFTEITSNGTATIASQIFDRSCHAIESEIVYAEAKATAVGVALSQTAHALDANSMLGFITSLVIPAISAAFVYKRMRKVKIDPSLIDKYITHARESVAEHHRVDRVIASENPSQLSLSLYEDTAFQPNRNRQVEDSRRSNAQVFSVLETNPWILASVAAFINRDPMSATTAIVTGGIINSALKPLRDELTRKRRVVVGNEAITKLQAMLDAIDQSPYQVRTQNKLEKERSALSGDVLTTREAALEAMSGHPLIVHRMDLKLGDRRMRVKDGAPLEFKDISFIVGPSGIGKTTLLRVIAGIQDADSLVVTKGLDLRLLQHDVRKDTIFLFHKEPPNTATTMIEQLAAAAREGEDNIFTRAFNTMNTFSADPKVNAIKSSLHNKFGFSDADINKTLAVFQDPREKEYLLDYWISNHNEKPSAITYSIGVTFLDYAALLTVQPLFPYLDTPERVLNFLARTPGGISDGERARWGIRKATLKRRSVLLLDEPTANLDDEGAASSFILTTGMLTQYKQIFPDTPIIIATNDLKLPLYIARNTEYNRGKVVEHQGQRNDFFWQTVDLAYWESYVSDNDYY